MQRGSRYLPPYRRGRRRLGALGLGLLAAFTLVWQQQATEANFVDAEHSKAGFTAATLEEITPTLKPGYASVDASWDAASRSWVSPQYSLDWSPDYGGFASTNLYNGTETSATLSEGTGTQSSYALQFTDVAAGVTHACGIAQSSVYCWGTSAAGGLGLGAITAATVPTKVTGGQLGTQSVVQISAGTNFSCARTSAGKAYCWGEGSAGQLGYGTSADSTTPRLVSSLTSVTSISTGNQHACAVSSGKAYCWGSDSSGQLGDNTASASKNVPTAVYVSGVMASRVVSSVSAGTSHSCAVADGLAFCWGINGSGRLGNSSATTSNVPVAVTTSGVLRTRTITQVNAGNDSTCAVADQEAFCWGNNGSGQLGNSSTTSSTSPVAVTASVMTGEVTVISSGYNHACAVADGDAYCWGDSTYAQLGNGTGGTSSSPVRVAGTFSSRTATTVSAGKYFGCITGRTPAACWGLGTSGQLGYGGSTTKSMPVDVALDGQACPSGAVRVGTNCSLVEGTDYYFRLGYSIGSWTAPNSDWKKTTTKTRDAVDPSLDTRTTKSITSTWPAVPEAEDSAVEYTLQRSLSSDGANPATIATTSDQSATDSGGVAPPLEYSQISAGNQHTCGIVEGSLYCWGRNSNGQLGLGNTTDVTEPKEVTYFAGKTVTDVSAGSTHTCAVADGQVYCWGLNSSGQIGDGSYTTRTSPVAVSGQSGYTVTDVAVGTSHSCAITEGGDLWCWGLNAYGQLGNGTTTTSAVPVGPIVGAMGSGTATAVTAGLSHTCAVANSRAYCWGRSNYGQAGSAGTSMVTPTAVNTSYDMGTAAVTAISAGSIHTCAIANSRAYCWGRNYYGQFGDGTTSASDYRSSRVTTTTMSGAVSSISSGTDHVCAVASGKAYCWGRGTYSQLGNSAASNSYVPVAVTALGSLGSATADTVTAGGQHSCGVFSGMTYCWGVATYGRLGNRSTLTISYPSAVPLDSVCGDGAASLGDGKCTLAADTTYYYRVRCTLDGDNAKTGSWVALKTAS